MTSNSKQWLTNRTLLAVAIWVLFFATLFACALLSDSMLVFQKSLVGLLSHFIGTVYWGDRVRRHPAWAGYGEVREDSPKHDRTLADIFFAVLVLTGVVGAIWPQLP